MYRSACTRWIFFALGVGDAKLTRHGGRQRHRQTQATTTMATIVTFRESRRGYKRATSSPLMMSMGGKKGQRFMPEAGEETASVPAPAAW